jgi:hypothetical protein
MALSVSHKCRFPNDLDFANKQMEAELANRVLANQELLKQAEAATLGLDALLDEGNGILNSFFPKNDPTPAQRPLSEKNKLADPDPTVPTVDNQPSSSYDTSSSLKSTVDVADTYGLLPDKSTREQDEKFVANAGLVLLNNIVYLPGKQSGNPIFYANIKILRKLYFALGLNLKSTKEIMNPSYVSKTTFIYDKLNLRILPPKSYQKAYSLEEVRDLLKADYLTSSDIATTHDYGTVVLLKSFLVVDKSKAEVLRTTGIAPEELICNVFHFGSVDNSTAALSRYAFLGYTGDELGAILAGQDLINYNPEVLTNTASLTRVAATKLVQYLEFLKAKYSTISTTYKRSAINQTRFALSNMIKNHKKTISLCLFQVSTVLQKDVIDTLALKHTDDDIEYLLRKRQDVSDLWFGPSDDNFLKALKRAMDAAPPGSTYISNKAVNKRSEDIYYSQIELLRMYADLVDATNVANNADLSISQINLIQQYLTNMLARKPEQVPSTAAQNILQGQLSAATPSGIIAERMDPMATMDFDKKKEAVKDSFRELISMYPASISGPLSEIIDKITALFEKAMKAINLLIAQAQKVLLAAKKRLDAFISQYLTLTGSGAFEKSLLKCAINWDIGLSTDILDILADFFNKFIGGVLSFLSSLKKWITDLLETVLCLPVDLLNNFLGQVQISLPSACKLPRFDLGASVSTSLKGLKDISIAQSVVLQSFGKDMAKLRINVSAASNKLAQFKSSAGCSSSAGSNFMNASMLNVGVKVGF